MNNLDIINNIDFNIDYYDILGIKKEDLLDDFNEESIDNRRKNSKMLHEAYRKKAHAFHPDLAPEGQRQDFESKFKSVVKAYSILSDPYIRRIYDNKEYNSNSGKSITIDWSMVGKFKKNSIENEVGSSLFLSINENLKIKHYAFFIPNDEMYHNYIWELKIENIPKYLTISLVSDENEVMQLTSSTMVEQSLPFKIYIFFPQTSFVIDRGETDAAFNANGEPVVFPGKIRGIKYVDFELYAGTNLDSALEFIKSGELEKAIEMFFGGTK